MVSGAVRAVCEGTPILRGLSRTVTAVQTSLSPLEALAPLRAPSPQAQSVAALGCVAADMGINGQEVDVALAAALNQLALSPSDLKALHCALLTMHYC